MSYLFDCQCAECNHTFVALSSGGTFKAQRFFCDTCGKGLALPRYAPRRQRKANPARSFEQQQPDIPFEGISRFTDQELERFLDDPHQWLKWGDTWDDFEVNAILRIKGQCKCGGNWRSPFEKEDSEQMIGVKPNWLIRCPNCRSQNFTYTINSSVLSD